MGVWAFAPEKFLRATPSRTLENALLEHRLEVAIIIDFVPRRKTNPLAWKRKA